MQENHGYPSLPRAPITDTGARRAWGKRMRRLLRHPRDVSRALGRRLIGADQPDSPPAPINRSCDTESPPESADFAYPHLRLGLVGRPMNLDGIAPTFDVASAESAEIGESDFDLVLVDLASGAASDGVRHLLRELRDRDIPVVIWVGSAEDLQNDTSALADVLVTTDYRLSAGRASGRPVFIPPSIDPLRHNPTAWPRLSTSGLVVVTDRPLDPAASHRLDKAIDRYRVLRPQDISYAAPEGAVGKEQNVKGSVAAYLADNALTPTVLLRLLELAASGVPILSSPSPVLQELLDGNYGTVTGDGLEEAIEAVSAQAAREKLSIAARRHVLLTHSHRRRFDRLLELVGIPTIPSDVISVLMATARPDRLAHAISSFERQTWPSKELILILHGSDRFQLERVDRLLDGLEGSFKTVPCASNWTLGDCLNAGVHQATGTYVAKMDDDDYYGPGHLADLVAAMTYSQASVVGKLANPTYLAARDVTVDWRIGDQERKVHHIPGATMLMRRDLLESYLFNRVSRGVDSSLWERMAQDGHNFYSTHWLNFVRVRHGQNTYVRSDQDFVDLATKAPAPGLRENDWWV